MLTAATAIVVATDAQIAEFEMRLDAYDARLDAYEAKLDARDEAITKALMENRLELDRLYELRDQMLDNAYVLPDGTKVFKSEDGTKVYNQAGEMIPADIIDPDTIPDFHTKHEPFAANNDQISKREQIEDDLHRAQADNDQRREGLNEARDRIGDARLKIEEGGITVQEMEDIDKDILELMPSDNLPPLPVSAAKFLTDGDGIKNATSLKSDFAAPAGVSGQSNSPAPSTPSEEFSPLQPGG